MPAYYKIYKEWRLVMSTGAGVLTMAEALGHQEKLLKDPDFSRGFSQLMDLTQVSKLEFGTEDLRVLAQRNIFSPDSRRAILVSSDFLFGVSRMFAIFRDSLGETGIRVFRNLDPALEWALAKNTSA
jgi:hypothetical protein